LNRLLAGLLSGLLAGCVSQAPAPPPVRDGIADFAVDGRFALKTIDADGRPQSSGGRLSWTHRDGRDRVLLANPLGIGLAEIDMTPDGATLRTADDKTYTDSDPERLLADLTGQALPVSRLAGWLLGRPTPAGRLERDAQQRPLRLDEGDWRIDYLYDGDAPDLPPGRLNARGPAVDLRLRLENWKALP